MNNKKKEKEIKTQNFVADYYEKIRYEKEYSRNYHDYWFEEMLKMVPPSGLVLDNGCGTGELIAYLRKKGHNNIIGSDISEKMLAYAGNKGARELIRADAESLPFEDNVFDVIYARALLHHLLDAPKAIQEMKRVLKPNGLVIFADTHKTFISNLPRRIMNRGEHFSETHKNFETKELVSIIKKELEIKQIKHFGYLGYLFLGFPDILDIYRFVPFKKIFTPLLIWSDKVLSKTPVVKNLSFGIMISAIKK